MSKTAFLEIIYQTLYKTYGPQSWWPADTPFEVMLGAILTQNTSWTNVEKAMAGLKKVCELRPESILSLPSDSLEEAIRPSGYFRQKAKKLIVFCHFCLGEYGGDIEQMKSVQIQKMREQLLDLHGIGPETADSILLYALDMPVFVVDTYTIRLFSRLGMCTEKAKYGEVQSLFTKNLPPNVEVFNEYHALIVRHGKEKCRTNVPLCDECTLRDFCSYGSMGV
jgi:endonuclease-3 related protein